MDEKQVGKDKQATRYPIYKDVKGQWNFNYTAEERKRFKAELMWIPGVIPEEQVD